MLCASFFISFSRFLDSELNTVLLITRNPPPPTHTHTHLKPQDSFGRFVKNFLDLEKVDHTIRKLKPTSNCFE